MNKSKDNTN